MAFRTNKTPVLQTKSASGAVATFNTALAMPLDSCNIAVNAWQEGSGDPSPDNVRPIHGFSEVNATRCGKNLVDITDIDNTVTTVKTFDVRDKNINFPCFMSLHLSDDFAYSSNVWQARARLKDGTYKYAFPTKEMGGFINASKDNPVTDITCRCIYVTQGYYDVQVEAGSTATAYEPYVTPTIYTIQLGQDVYGGSYNSVSGKLLITDYIPDFTNASFFRNKRGGGATGYYFATSDWYARQLPLCSISTSDLTLAKIKERFNYGTIENPYNHIGNFAWAYSPDSNQTTIRISIDGIETLDAFNAIKSNLQVKYPLATPIEIQLTPTQIETLIGNNTIFADTGDIDLTYKDLDLAKRGNFREVFKLPS